MDKRKEKNLLERMMNPLYLPLYTAVPVAVVRLVHTHYYGPLHTVDFVTFWLALLALFATGVLGVTAHEKGWKLFGGLYLFCGVAFSVCGIGLIER